MGLESESFLGLYELGDLGRMRHFCVGVGNYNPDVLAETPLDHGIRSIGPVAGNSCISMIWKVF